MNLDDFSYQENDQRYINPQTSLDEQNAFIKSLRETQGARNEEIKQDTYNLGTQVPSNLGGLVGGESYFNARYQTPQTNALVADLRSAAQAQALNEAMSNEIAKAKRNYNLAARAARKRAKASGGSGTPTTNDPTVPDTTGKTDFVDSDTGFWDTANVYDDVVNYGLYQLKRNPGESDTEWNARSKKWINEMTMKNSFRSEAAKNDILSGNIKIPESVTNKKSTTTIKPLDNYL